MFSQMHHAARQNPGHQTALELQIFHMNRLQPLDMATPFIKAVKKTRGLRSAYIVTDDDRRF